MVFPIVGKLITNFNYNLMREYFNCRYIWTNFFPGRSIILG